VVTVMWPRSKFERAPDELKRAREPAAL